MIRQSCHFERDLDRVLLQLVDILNLNTQFKPRGQLTFIMETFVEQSVDELVLQSLIRYY